MRDVMTNAPGEHRLDTGERTHWLPLVLAGAGGVVFSLLLFAILQVQHKAQIEREFSLRVENHATIMKHAFDRSLQLLASIDDLFAASDLVDREEFHRFLKDHVKGDTGLQALEWIPRVPASSREAYEQAARADGYRDFSFTQREGQGRMVPADRRAEYFPVYYLEPHEGNEAAFGFDLGSSPARREALEWARDSGKPVTSGRFTLVQETAQQNGLLVIRPIYHWGTEVASVKQRREALRGYVIGVYRVAQMLENALKDTSAVGLDIALYDDSATAADRLLYFHPSRSRNRAVTLAQLEGSGVLHREVAFQVPDRRWRLDFYAAPSFFQQHSALSTWLILGSGLLITLLSVLYLWLGQLRRKAVNASETKYRMLANNSTDWISWMGPDRCFRYMSPSCEAITGYPSEDFLTDPGLLYRLIHPEDKVAKEHLIAVNEQDDEHAIDFRLLRKDGSLRWVRHRCHAMFDENGIYLGRLASNRDITPRKEAEEQLRKLSLAIEQSPENIIITNLAADIEYVNEAFLRNTGYEIEEVLGRNPRFLSSWKTPQNTYDQLWRDLVMGRTWKGEFINRRKDGSEYVEFAVISPLRGPEGEVTHYVAVKEDITQSKKLEAELVRHRDHLEELIQERTAQLQEARARAETATRAKSDFLANMSHEIRTPMNAVISMLHLVLKTRLDPGQRDYIAKAQTSAKGLLGIINDILDLSKIEAGRLELEETDFRLEDVIDDVAGLLLLKADAAGVKLSLSLSGDVPVALVGDPLRLGQILINLGSNAVRFTPAGGEVWVRVTLQRDDAQWAVLRFQVEDTGAGMSTEQQQRLFQPFSQVDGATSQAYGSTGLGLTITKRITELMQGEIELQSILGAGSTFSVTVRLKKQIGRTSPRARTHADEERRIAESLAGLRGVRLLLVEDNDINRELAMELLAGEGLQVATAVNGAHALALLEHHHFDAVLMDCQMPVMDGYTATRKIREQARFSDLPIIAMTADDRRGDREKALDAGMNDQVVKPIDVNALLRTLVKWIKPAHHPVMPKETSCDASDRPLHLPRVSGIDIEAGLEIAQGNSSLYRKLLLRFRQQQANFEQEFQAAWNTGDRATATRLAHTLKGVAANLGITGVQQAAGALEKVCAADAGEIAAPYDSLVRELSRVLAGLQSLDATAEPAAAMSHEFTETATVELLLKELHTLVTEGDTSAYAAAERLRDLLAGTQHEKPAHNILEVVGVYDFEVAEVLINQLTRDLNVKVL